MGKLLSLEFRYWQRTSITSVPYEAYVPHTLAGWFPSPSSATMARVAVAQRRLANLSTSVVDTPALRWCLNRAEGIASSSVEGIATTLRSLSLLESLRGRRRQDTDDRDHLALGNVRLNAQAVALGERTGSDVSVDDILGLHRQLFTGTEQQFGSGCLRDEQVWVGGTNRSPAGAVFVPPPHDDVPALMDDLVRCISGPAWGAPVAKAAIVHTQFETIHPFTDGNGRTGRGLLHLVLRRDGHLTVPVPISAAVDARRDDYYHSLRPYQTFIGDRDDADRAAAVAATVEYIAEATVVACDYAEAASHSISSWMQRCDAAGFRKGSAARSILGMMQTMPAATPSYLMEQAEGSDRSVTRGLRHLADAGLITEGYDSESGSRTLEVPEVLTVVDNRTELLDECWDLNIRGQQGVSQRLLQRINADVAKQKSTSGGARPRCGHIGVRNGKPCDRRAGHSGAHHYPS